MANFKKANLIKLGISLILLSGAAFAIMLIIPFLNLEAKTKVFGSSVSFIAMEVLFWSGGLLVGKELFTKYKSYLDPRLWFKKNKSKLVSVDENLKENRNDITDN